MTQFMQNGFLTAIGKIQLQFQQLLLSNTEMSYFIPNTHHKTKYCKFRNKMPKVCSSFPKLNCSQRVPAHIFIYITTALNHSHFVARCILPDKEQHKSGEMSPRSYNMNHSFSLLTFKWQSFNFINYIVECLGAQIDMSSQTPYHWPNSMARGEIRPRLPQTCEVIPRGQTQSCCLDPFSQSAFEHHFK